MTASPGLPLLLLTGRRSPPAGRDRRARLLPGHPGRARPERGREPRVAVVGGGVAGVAAAVALAERGVRVVLHERHDELGGRVRGWTTPTGETMTRGFHAFFRQYYNLRALLRRADPDLARLRPVPDYPLLHANGTRESFARLPLTPPWNVAGFVLRSETFTLRDLTRMDTRAATALFDVSLPRTYTELDGVDADGFLRGIRFPEAARHLAFEVFSRSFFAHPSALSAAELATMFHIYFLGSSEGLLFDVPDDTYPAAIWEPMRRHLAALGVQVRTGSAVERVTRRADGYRVVAGGEEDVDAVVLAVDVTGLRALVGASPELATPGWRARVADLRTTPPFLVSRLWLDRPARPDRAPFLGTSGFGRLDNVSVLDHFEAEARAYRDRTGGSVVELHAYALAEDCDQDEVVATLVRELEAVYPELSGARVRQEEHVLSADCPLFAPGSFTARPTVTTPDPTLVVAGDLARVDLPVALMERAATTGFLAANSLLGRWGLRGHDLWTVPNRGRSALLRHAATRARAVARV
ncbi:FAD-dependent oxidoreductase [Saccharothrix algeriensis]|uniref:Isorenieratene synthase n=1 Tax=Saccharothrix algeriensis TaxID=173560 RepID=A0ABS2S0T3_9PSEU|nr:FAD-dependent oxidoreductase [Saccharothrix algeriensis]MBM7809838.1 isorenieratene synthase [Saccharothrix algeriensis]